MVAQPLSLLLPALTLTPVASPTLVRKWATTSATSESLTRPQAGRAGGPPAYVYRSYLQQQQSS